MTTDAGDFSDRAISRILGSRLVYMHMWFTTENDWTAPACCSHRATLASRRRGVARRLSMPEVLEGRNAPSSMLALPPIFEVFGAAAGTESALVAEPSTHTGHVHYRAAVAPPLPALLSSVENLFNALRAAEGQSQHGQAHMDMVREVTEFRTHDKIAALSMAWDSLDEDGFRSIFFDARIIPPSLIQPVELPEELPQDHEEPLPLLNDMGTPSPVQRAPIVSGGDASASRGSNVAPPAIHPVITEPDSAHNRPDHEPEVPPSLVQPVIMDPESEHNRE